MFTFIFKHFPGTFISCVVSVSLVIYTIVAAEQSVQLTAFMAGLFSGLSGYGIGVIFAAYSLRRN